MNVFTRVISVLGLVLFAMVADACKVKRCPLDNCHIRMRHRHPSTMGGGKGESAPLVYDANAGPEANLGPVYRGIPWWQFYRETKVQPGAKNYKTVKTRDPKIGQGYKPGYKYKHKDNKPWSERMKKYKQKKIEDQEKSNKKAGKEPENLENEEDLDNQEEAKPKDSGVKIVGDKNAKPADEDTDLAEEEEAPKKAKKEKKQKAEKPKKEKKSKKKAPATEEEPEEKEDEGF